MTKAVLSNVVVRFGGVVALSGLDLRIEPGVIHGLIGPNGAGKSTALNVLCGLATPASGTYMLRDEPAPQAPAKLARLGVARTFQTPAIFRNLSVIQNIMIGGYLGEKVGLVEAACRLPSFGRKENALRARARDCARRLRIDIHEDCSTDNLSLGHLRKIELARAVMSAPKLLLLDEVTSGLTEAEVAEVSDLLTEIAGRYRSSMSIVVVEHNVPFIFGLCGVVSAMDQGRLVVTGTPAEVRSHPAVIASYMGETTQSAPPLVKTGGGVIQALRPGADTGPLLEVENLAVGFGATPVLKGVSVTVGSGEVVALLGRNGAGKTTLVGAVAGILRTQSGSVRFCGRTLTGLAAHAIVKAGIGMVPQLGGIAARQTVRDNLEIAAFGLKASKQEIKSTVESLLDLFPNLRARMDVSAGSLSGGERKMLAITNVMIRRPKLVIFDEPSLGLSPIMISQIQDAILKIKDRGISAIIAEQNIGWLKPLADQAYLLDLGQIVARGTLSDLSRSDLIANAYLGREVPSGETRELAISSYR